MRPAVKQASAFDQQVEVDLGLSVGVKRPVQGDLRLDARGVTVVRPGLCGRLNRSVLAGSQPHEHPEYEGFEGFDSLKETTIHGMKLHVGTHGVKPFLKHLRNGCQIAFAETQKTHSSCNATFESPPSFSSLVPPSALAEVSMSSALLTPRLRRFRPGKIGTRGSARRPDEGFWPLDKRGQPSPARPSLGRSRNLKHALRIRLQWHPPFGGWMPLSFGRWRRWIQCGSPCLARGCP